MKDLMPGFEELHIAKVADNTYIVRTDKGVVVTAQNFGQAVKRAREFFGEVIVKPRGEAAEAEAE